MTFLPTGCQAAAHLGRDAVAAGVAKIPGHEPGPPRPLARLRARTPRTRHLRGREPALHLGPDLRRPRGGAGTLGRHPNRETRARRPLLACVLHPGRRPLGASALRGGPGAQRTLVHHAPRGCAPELRRDPHPGLLLPGGRARARVPVRHVSGRRPAAPHRGVGARRRRGDPARRREGRSSALAHVGALSRLARRRPASPGLRARLRLGCESHGRRM
jgi:hypothetical protein